jgi:AcrR family transcriptional regulator
MGIVERREREREAVRRKILDAARELFARHGYEHVTMRALADVIEYSPTTIYHHFEDKEDLVEALCHEDFGRLFTALTAEGLPADPVERIRQMGRAYAAFAQRFPNHYQFMFMTPKLPDHKLDPAEPGSQAFQLLRDDTPADTIAQVVWASLHGATALLVTYGAEKFPCVPAAPDLIEQTCENALRGWLA